MTWEPYLELECLDCGNPYPADRGDCPNCGSANCSYDSAEAKRYDEEPHARDEWAEEIR